MKITVLGYYEKQNYGDDLFHLIFSRGLAGAGHEVAALADPNGLAEIDPGTEVLLCGGGDVVTAYFMKKILALKEGYERATGRRLPTYAVSVGLSFPEELVDGRSHWLDVFDHVTFRSRMDYDLMVDRYGQDRVSYLPDLVFALPQFLPANPQPVRRKPLLGVCLARPIFANGRNANYDSLVRKLAAVIDELSATLTPVFLEFNTSSSPNEADALINRDVMQAMKSPGKELLRSVPLVVETPADVEKTLRLFRRFSTVLAMRFHAHVLCVLAETPFASLSTSSKTENLMRDSGLERSLVIMEKNPKETYPADFDEAALLRVLSERLEPPPAPAASFEQYLAVLEAGRVNEAPPFYLSPEVAQSTVDRVLGGVAKLLCRWGGVQFDPAVHGQELARNKTISKFYRVLTGQRIDRADERLKELLVSFVDYSLTGDDNSSYHYGLGEQIFNLNLQDGFEWILNHLAFSSRLPSSDAPREDRALPALPAPPAPQPAAREPAAGEPAAGEPESRESVSCSVNLSYVNQNLARGLHRFGWAYVMGALEERFGDDGAPLVLDGFLDKTFHWSKELYLELGKIPYRRPWVGFLHHTPTPSYTKYNTESLVRDPAFVESLPQCKGIFVLSNSLAGWLREALGDSVPVHVLDHPTGFVARGFSLEDFFSNPQRSVVQVGGWLRDPYAIYDLKVNTKRMGVTKAALKGKAMDNYFLPPGLTVDDLISQDLPAKPGAVSGDRASFQNKFVEGLVATLRENQDSVEVMSELGNEEYDDLLSKNIVFLRLVDASASNTVNECIVRSTPVLVNRHPAMEEVLGKDYPFFYDSLAEAGDLATDAARIVQAHLHLLNLPKDRFSLETFLDNFAAIVSRIEL